MRFGQAAPEDPVHSPWDHRTHCRWRLPSQKPSTPTLKALTLASKLTLCRPEELRNKYLERIFYINTKDWRRENVHGVSSRCVVKIKGEMVLSFPAGITRHFSSHPTQPVLTFSISNFSRLEQVLPNPQLLCWCEPFVLLFAFTSPVCSTVSLQIVSHISKKGFNLNTVFTFSIVKFLTGIA